MKNLFAFTIMMSTIALTFSSCSEEVADPCDGIVCVNGDCVNGNCDCEQGWSGSDCSTQLTPTSMSITSIKITRFPATDSNGAGWDLFDGPDVYVQITGAGGVIGIETGYIENANPQQDYTFSPSSWSTNNDFADVTSQYTISAYDYDGIDDDLLGGIYFTPYSTQGGFPTTQILDAGGSVAFEVNYSYNW